MSRKPFVPLRIFTPILTAVIGCTLLASAARGAAGPRSVWVVSTRESGCGAAPHLRYWRHVEGNGWLESSQAEFMASDEPNVPTTIWIHGNRIGFCESQSNGYRAYRGLACQAGDRPFRFVVWSWPADQVAGQLDDIKLKAARSDCESYNLAWLVNRMHPDVPVSFLGYSYGARLAAGALHILGGGHVNGRSLGDQLQSRRVPLRAVMMAAALDNHWLAMGHRLGQAFQPVDRMLVMVNPSDKVLSKYHLLYGWKRGPEALGATGVCGGLGEHSPKLAQLNVSGAVGAEHDWRLYMESPHLVRRMKPYALFEP